MDNLAVRLAGPAALVVDIHNLREPGIYHQMLKQELQLMMSAVSSMNHWGAQCILNNTTCDQNRSGTGKSWRLGESGKWEKVPLKQGGITYVVYQANKLNAHQG